MPITAPPTITALPTPPDPNDRSTFNARAYPWSVAQQTLATEANAVAANVYANAQDAAAQANLATTKAGEATISASNAATSATTASTKASEAATSAADSEASRIAASKLNLGNKTAPPTVDNQGAALLAGATYYDTTLNKWRVWNGSAWTDGISAVAGVTSVNGQTGDLTGFVTDTGVQTLANKTLTDPKITLGGTNGAAGQVPVSQGAGLPPVWGAKQDTLVSGTNIKTINGGSVLGSGDLTVGGGSLILLSTVTANNSATVDLETGVGSTYDDYLVICENIGRSNNTSNPLWRVKISGAYSSDAMWRSLGWVASSGGISGLTGSGASDGAYPTGGITEGGTTSQFAMAWFMNCNSATDNKSCRISHVMPGVPGSGGSSGELLGAIQTTSVIQGFRFMFSAGNVSTGTFRLYGIKKS